MITYICLVRLIMVSNTHNLMFLKKLVISVQDKVYQVFIEDAA